MKKMNEGWKKIESAADLDREIRILEYQCLEKKELIKQEVGNIAHALRPAALLQKSIPAIVSVSRPSLKKNLVRKGIGLVSGIILKQIFSKRRKSP